MTPLEFIEKLRHELKDINDKILKHPFITEAVQGNLSLDKIKLFVENQFYIASNDSKALAIMYSRAEYPDNEFFLKLLVSHQKALERLRDLINYFKIDLREIKVNARIVSYTHFFFNLAFLGSLQEQIVAILINFPIFIEAINKLGKALKENYQIQEVSFFQEAKWDRELEYLALKILEKYNLQDEKIKRTARLIQEYELEYWDSLLA